MSKTFKKYMKSLGDSLDAVKHIQAIRDYATFQYIMTRPIGLVTKSYGFMRNTLSRNIGDGVHEYDGYSTPIGELANTEYNLYSDRPWFNLDEKKKKTTNYLEYIEKTYGKNNLNINEDNSFFSFYNDNKVGVLRNIYYKNGDIITNPNTYEDDTILGNENGYFLGETIRYSQEQYKYKKNSTITENAYSNFGYYGEFGFNNGELYLLDNRVRTQDELFINNDIIPWSTTDHMYNSKEVGDSDNENLTIVKNIFKLDTTNGLSINYTDETKNSDKGTLYYPFGNFYSNTYSLGLLSSTNTKTKEFISNSMLGYNLLGNKKGDIDMRYDGNIKSPKKYYVGEGTRGSNYIDKLSGIDVNFIKYFNENTNLNEIIRLEFPDMGNDSLWSTRALYTYAEAEGKSLPSTMGTNSNTWNEGVEYGRHIAYNKEVTKEKKDIVHYTNRMFQDGNYKTLISRFHTDEIGIDGSRGNRDLTSTAISQYGMSHGRNLLKKNHKDAKDNGYSNPYCRTWTYHHQYHTLKDVIRPFDGVDDGEMNNSGIFAYRTTSGLTKLSTYGAKQSNGLVRITPTSGSGKDFGVKRCMFSIENLAWKGEKDFFKGREDQKGPLGGRIMWFPPYDLKFSENVNVNWNPNQFIGRGESIYTYTNTERGGQLSFKILIDHPSIVNQWRGDIRGGDGIGDVDDVDSNEQQLLRFFAGCELLSVEKPENINKEPLPKIEPKVKNVETPVVKTDELVFYVFYPNNYSGVDDIDGVVNPMEYLINGIGANKVLNGNKIVDYPTVLNKRYYGYEMGNSKGISNTDVKNVSGLTDPLFKKGTKISDNVTLEQDVSYQYCYPNKGGKHNYWAYRCDKAYENQVLHTFNGKTRYNYYDSKDFGLNNTNGYLNLTKAHKNDEEKLNNGRLFSFADVFCAIQQEGKNILEKNVEYNETSVKIISELLGVNKEKYTIEGVEVRGFASSHGYKKSNDTLGKNRAESVLKWLKMRLPNKFNDDSVFKYETNKIGDELSNYDSNSFLAKVWRCSRVVIKIRQEDVILKTEVIDMPKENEGYYNITYADNKTDREIDKAVTFAEKTKEVDKDKLKTSYLKRFGQNMSNVQLNATVNQIEQNKSMAEAEAMSALTEGNTVNIMGDGQIGYGSEYKFFSELSSEEPFLHSKIVEKLKYFDPAFHSITPEGFQSRLTFLHQCTRQGNTSAASDTNNMNRTANNLAFGRPPICVLRIGDFYNTKIIIDSLSIDYDDTTWDLNDEGIGVMPMMANVNISFKFLGGSDLSGPINRLQNALSFNHYANTSVYDNRAEEVEYDDKGEIKNFNFKS